MKILFISRWFPYPPDNGSKIRIYNLIKALARQHEVDLISFATAETKDQDIAMMGRYCRQQVDVIHYQPYSPWRGKALMGFFSTKPRSVIDTYSPEMDHRVKQRAQTRAFDAVIASQVDVAPYAVALPVPIKIFEEVELTTRYEQISRQTHPLKKVWSRLSWGKLSRYMDRLVHQFEGCTVVSTGERDQLLRVSPGYKSIGVIPNGVDTSHYMGHFGTPEPNTLIYSGALTYQANFDAMDYFLAEIFPLVRAECPSVKLFITGKVEGVPIEHLPQYNEVIFTGYLNDIRPRLAQSWVSIVPLRLGGGTRLKVLESLAIGTPVVATHKGAEGIEVKAEHDLLIADNPADFAAAILRLLQNPSLRQMLSQNGQQTVRAKYEWQMIGGELNNFIESIAARHNLKAEING